jgi:hypothetical protein
MSQTSFEILFTTDGPEPEARALADAVLAAWPTASFAARTLVVAPAHLDAALSGRASARRAVVALIRGETPDPSPSDGGVALVPRARPGLALLLGALRKAAQRGVPGLLLADADAPAEISDLLSGLAPMPRLDAATPAQTLAGVLTTLALQRDEIANLRDEVRAARAGQTGLRHAIDRLHEELELAARVQREYLPITPPTIPDFEVAVLFRPCGYVSGDLYDFRALDRTKTGFLIADAVGHGVPAALFTMSISRSLPTHESAGGRILEPAEAIELLNRRMCEQPGGRHRLATGVYGILDHETRRLTLACAGHPPPLLHTVSGVQPLDADGLILGVEESTEFTQVSVELAPGDSVVFYTDGLESAFPDAQAPDETLCHPTRNHLPHLAALCARAREWGAGRLGEELAFLMDEQRGSLHQADDVTAIVLHALTGPAAAPDS